jgi:hypothetical protein
MKTTLQPAKAKSVVRRSRSTHSEKLLQELAVAYLTGEIDLTAVNVALKQSGSSSYGAIAVALRRAYAA